MRNFLSILMIGILLTACKQEAKKTSTGYVVNGTAKGVYNGMRVYLNAADERGAQIPIDTAIVMNETFKFEGSVDNPQLWFLSVNNVNGFVRLMIENDDIDVNFKKDDIEASTVTGTRSNEALTDYTKGFKDLVDQRVKLSQQQTISASPDGPDQASSMQAELNKINQKLQDYPFEFMKKNNDNYFSLSLLENILMTNPEGFDQIDASYNNLNSDIKSSTFGQIVANKIDILKKQNERFAMLNIGKVAPEFSAPDPDGKQISLSDIRGKATIIDFWAAWCGPCRRENPNVVKVYNKYHKKGLEIIGVSLDRPGQKDKWLQAIKDDKLTWHQVSHLNYFNDPVAQQYQIQSIPATFILDAEGKIVAKNLRGQALEDKIAEMLN